MSSQPNSNAPDRPEDLARMELTYALQTLRHMARDFAGMEKKLKRLTAAQHDQMEADEIPDTWLWWAAFELGVHPGGQTIASSLAATIEEIETLLAKTDETLLADWQERTGNDAVPEKPATEEQPDLETEARAEFAALAEDVQACQDDVRERMKALADRLQPLYPSEDELTLMDEGMLPPTWIWEARAVAFYEDNVAKLDDLISDCRMAATITDAELHERFVAEKKRLMETLGRTSL